jgi:hypothetical protein
MSEQMNDCEGQSLWGRRSSHHVWLAFILSVMERERRREGGRKEEGGRGGRHSARSPFLLAGLHPRDPRPPLKQREVYLLLCGSRPPRRRPILGKSAPQHCGFHLWNLLVMPSDMH